jgi:O-antigen/teichoic acid export membrane protein
MLGEKQAGYYSVSASMADLIYMLPSVIGMILFPKLSSLKTKKEKWELTKKVTGIVLGVMMVLAGISTILCEPIVRILYGNKFLPAVPAFIWLMPGIVLYGSTFSSLFVLSIGQPRGVLFIWAFLVALNVMMNYYIIRIGGIVGAAIVSSITYGTCFVIYWVYAWRLSLDR